jgi:hypothetical protein
MIGMMLTVLVCVVVAVEKTRVLSIQLSSAASDVPAGWGALPAVFVLTAILSGTVAIIALGLLKLLRR